MEHFNILKRINETYQKNIEQIGKELSYIGINVRKNKNEYKLLPEVIKEISTQWDELSMEDNKIHKEWICRTIAGIRDKNYLIVLIDNLHKGNNLMW